MVKEVWKLQNHTEVSLQKKVGKKKHVTPLKVMQLNKASVYLYPAVSPLK